MTKNVNQIMETKRSKGRKVDLLWASELDACPSVFGSTEPELPETSPSIAEAHEARPAFGLKLPGLQCSVLVAQLQVLGIHI